MSQSFSSEEAAAGGGGGGESSTGGGGLLPFYHVPQQSRREKLRYPPPCTLDVVDPSLFNMASASTSFLQNPDANLSYSSGNPQPQFEVEELQYQHLFPQRLVRGPAEPFTGYAAVLRASRFLRPAQHLLEEICDVGLTLQPCTDDSLGDPPSLTAADDPNSPYGERRRTKTRLLSMLDEVCMRYKQYYQQVLDVVASFESVAGLRNAAPYTSLALNSMTRHFRSLKNALSEQLHFTERVPGKDGHSKDELPGFGILNGGLCYPGSPARASGTIIQPNIWRPQRGLPERAVSVLKAWLYEHFLHPYPSDADKHMLARQTGLSRNQVSNWFINARVRLWKPMVEEIHALEMRQGHKGSDQATNFNGSSSAQANVPTTSNHPSSEQASQDTAGVGREPGNPHKRFRNELAEMSNHMEGPMGFSFNEFSSIRASVDAGAALLPCSSNGGVSLTLGLHQNNNGVCLPEALPFNVARRFGLEDTGTHYAAIGGFEVQDRHFGKDMEGRLLRDFGG